MDHARGLVFHRPQAASHRRAVVYFCSAVLTFRPTHDVGPHKQCISGLNHAAYGLPVNASRPGSPQAHASLGSGWRPTLAGWDWIPTGFRTRFQRSHHGILSPLTGLSRHTRCCMKTLCEWGGVARTSRDPPHPPSFGFRCLPGPVDDSHPSSAVAPPDASLECRVRAHRRPHSVLDYRLPAPEAVRPGPM